MKQKKSLHEKKIVYLFEKYRFDIYLFLIPIFFAFIFGVLTLIERTVTTDLKRFQLLMKPYIVNVSEYPFLNRKLIPPISAESALIMDVDSKTILFAKNPDLRFSMASTTKIMTALVALDYFQPKDILTVFTSNVEGVTVGFAVGERIYFEDALYAMLLPSGNDAAYLIAQNYPGGMEAFVAKMNAKAQQLRLLNTHYSDPVGLDDDGNYTTAVDLAHLASIALKNKTISEISSTKSKIIVNVDQTKTYQLENLNKLLGQYGVMGLKTGYTEGAGGVLVTYTIAHGRTFIVVVMRSADRFADTQILLSYLRDDATIFTPRIGSYRQ